MANEVKIVGKNNTPAQITEKGEQVVTLYIQGQEINSDNPLFIKQTETGVIQSTFSQKTLPYTIAAGVNSYSIITQGSVAVDGVTVPSGTVFSASHPSQEGTVLSPTFTDVSGGSLFVTIGVKI
jgi:hypothetical protein